MCVCVGGGGGRKGAVVFRSLYLGGYDSVKSSFELNHKDSSILSRYLAAQVSSGSSLRLLCAIFDQPPCLDITQ